MPGEQCRLLELILNFIFNKKIVDQTGKLEQFAMYYGFVLCQIVWNQFMMFEEKDD